MNTETLPLISIVIPTYNHANFIAKALKSVINQTYKNWEIIIIDNQSVDETYEIINKFHDPRIKYFKISNNGVIAKSRNLGIKVSKGEWIAFLDSDDWWTEDKLEICLGKINKKIDFIYHSYEVVNKSKSFLKKKLIKGRQLKKPVLNDLLISTIIKGNPICNSSVIIRKNILFKIGGLNENKSLVGSDDYNTWLRVANITDGFLYVKKRLCYYLVHEFNTSKKDMSLPQRLAVEDFLYLFNNQQKINLEAKLRYISGSYNYLNKNHSQAKKDFMFVVINGDINLKLRSLIKIILIIFKNEKV